MEPLHPNALKVQAAFSAAGFSNSVVQLSSSTKTAKEASSSLGVSEAQIGKSIVFMIQERAVVCVLSGDRRVSLEKLQLTLGDIPRRATAEDVKALTGFPIGGVSPVALKEGVAVFLDVSLREHTLIWVAAGTPHAVISCSPEELPQVSGGGFVDISE